MVATLQTMLSDSETGMFMHHDIYFPRNTDRIEKFIYVYNFLFGTPTEDPQTLAALLRPIPS